jgi:hypothetical protein
MPNRGFPQIFPAICFESCLTEPPFFSILCVLSGEFSPSSTAAPQFGVVGWKGILQSRNKIDGMGPKSGRNGAPAPKSRVSLSDSEPRADRLPLGVRAESLAGISGVAGNLSAFLCALAFLSARRASYVTLSARHTVTSLRCRSRDTPKEKEEYCADVFATCTHGSRRGPHQD